MPLEKKEIVYQVRGMSCTGCEMKLEKALKQIAGVHIVKASFAESQVKVEFDPQAVSTDVLVDAINNLGYAAAQVDSVDNSVKKETGKSFINQTLGIGIIVFACYWIINSTAGLNFSPEVDQSFSYGMLFVVGLLTSFHCIAMCGGINLSQSISYKQPASGGINQFRWDSLKPGLLYNAGRVVSYTVIGGLVGALGSVISFSGTAKGFIAIGGGVFMVIIGLNMLELFPWLRKIRIHTPKFFGKTVFDNAGKRGPFIVGLLNGLMPCGPLQTMQLYALGTGSFIGGAISMFLFSLGTVPLMFGFGAISSFLSSKFTRRVLKISAILVIVLGLTMVNRGLSLSGLTLAAIPSGSGNSANIAKINGNVQEVSSRIESGRYQPLVVQKGIPVRWTIKVRPEDLNGCNNPVTIPKYGIEKRLIPGDNVIEFTPDEVGNITYTCWMGMISSNIKVVDDLSKISKDDINLNPDDSSGIGGGSCCSVGAKATRFQNGNIPTDEVQIAKKDNDIQEVTIRVNDEGFWPAVAVVQKGLKVKIIFVAEKLNTCNYAVVFPEYQGKLDFSKGQTETPLLEVAEDITFSCWMGMLNGYIKAVDDINKVDIKAIKEELKNYRPSGGNGGGCCGG